MDEFIGVDVLSSDEAQMLLDTKEDSQLGEEIVVVEPEYSSLYNYILKTFQNNKDSKSSAGIDDEIFTSLRDYKGEYSTEDLQRIEMEGGSSIFMNVTATKVRAAQSWIRDILLASNEDSFSVKPTPIPSLPEDIEEKINQSFASDFEKEKNAMIESQGGISTQQAQDLVTSHNRDKRDVKEAILEEINMEAISQMALMERQIKDDLKEGKWEEALSDFIEDFCIFPAAIMKAPVITKKEKIKWKNGIPTSEEAFVFLNKRISPLDIYPSPSASSPQEGDFVEHMRLSLSELLSLKGVEGYNTEAIEKVIENNISGVNWFDTGIESEKAEEENKGNYIYANDGVFHALHFWGLAKREDLIEWGLVFESLEDDEREYEEIEAILVGTEVIKCQLNTDPLKRRPYYKASYQNIPGSFWGRSLPSLMRDIQRMCNACARALANNMGLAAGPQIEIYTDRLADAGDIEQIKPLKIWQVTTDPTGSSGRAVSFFQVPSIANELLAVYDKFEQKADDATGIPRYAYGNERVGGAAQTASGLSMLLESATKSIKDAIRHIDTGLIIPRVEYQFYWNVIKNELDYTGEIEVIALGSSTLTVKGAQTAKRQEFLQITANENDQKLMGLEGRAELIRILSKDLGLTTQIVPSRLELKKILAEEKQAQQQMQQAQAQAQQEKTSASIEATKIQIEGQERMHQQTQQLKSQELALKSQDSLERNTIEREKLQALKEANSSKIAVASEANQVKQNIARTNVAAKIVGGNANS